MATGNDTSDFLGEGESFEFAGAKVTAINMEWDGDGYRMKCNFEFPWGYSEEFHIWDGGWICYNIYSDTVEDHYDGRYDYCERYYHYICFDCVDAADFSGLDDDQIKIKITYIYNSDTEKYLDNVGGDDTNFGLNWDDAWKTLNHAADTIPDGQTLVIACGDYTTPYGTASKVVPQNVGTSGITYELEDHNTTGTMEVLAGELAQIARYNFQCSLWGQHDRYYYNSAYNYIHGYTASICEFIDSDISLQTGDLTTVLKDLDLNQNLFAGAGLVLDQDYVWNVVEINNNDQVYYSLTHNDVEVDDGIMGPDETYVYKKTVTGVSNFPIIAIRVGDVFSGMESTLLKVRGIWQVNDFAWEDAY